MSVSVNPDKLNFLLDKLYVKRKIVFMIKKFVICVERESSFR